MVASPSTLAFAPGGYRSDHDPFYSTTAFKQLSPLSILYTATVHLTLLLIKPIQTLPWLQSFGHKNAIEKLHPQDCFVVPRSSGSAKKHVAIVTGSNTGIGFYTASALVDHGYEVILACRSRDKGEKAANMINQSLSDDNITGKAIFLHPLDLSSLSSVKEFANCFKSKYNELNILVNNAGINTTGKSCDGMDLCFQTNFVGHFLLTTKLLPELLKAKNRFMLQDKHSTERTQKDLEESGRVVNLSSVTHHFVRADEERQHSSKVEINPKHDHAWWEGCIEPGVSSNTYKESKLASIVFTYELNKRYGEQGLRSIAVNPGAVNSDIWRGYPRWIVRVFKLLFLTSKEGSSTSVCAAIGKVPEGALYLQPYWQPSRSASKETERKVPCCSRSFRRRYGVPFPLFEMLGKYVGYAVTEPRIPTSIEHSSSALWQVCESIQKKKLSSD